MTRSVFVRACALTAFAAAAFAIAIANAQTSSVPAGKLPNITTQPTQPVTRVICVAPMTKVGGTCQCPDGMVKTSPTTCALRAFVPLETSDD